MRSLFSSCTTKSWLWYSYYHHHHLQQNSTFRGHYYCHYLTVTSIAIESGVLSALLSECFTAKEYHVVLSCARQSYNGDKTQSSTASLLVFCWSVRIKHCRFSVRLLNCASYNAFWDLHLVSIYGLYKQYFILSVGVETLLSAVHKSKIILYSFLLR